jgi:hypothetical protein
MNESVRAPITLLAPPRYRLGLLRDRTFIARFGDSAGAHFAEANVYRVGAGGECAELVRRANNYAEALAALRLLCAATERLLHATSRAAVIEVRGAQELARDALKRIETR